MADRCVHWRTSRGHDRSGGTFLRVPDPRRERWIAGGFVPQCSLPDLPHSLIRYGRHHVGCFFSEFAWWRAGMVSTGAAQAVSGIFPIVRPSPSCLLVHSFRPLSHLHSV